MADLASDTDSATLDAQALGMLLSSSPAIALAVVRQGRIVFANAGFQTRFKSVEPLTGLLLADVLVDIDVATLQQALAGAERAPERLRHVEGQNSYDGTPLNILLQGANLLGEPAVIALAVAPSERDRSADQLARLAYTDTLTGLANRSLFIDRLHELMGAARRTAMMFAVLTADLDGFKSINDSYGHDSGDVALQIAGQRFQNCIRASDTLARLGGDEFAVLLPQLGTPDAATVVARRMIAALSEPIGMGTHTVRLGTSIGIAVYPEHATTTDALLMAADAAMYAAKRSGKNRYRWAEPPVSQHALSSLSLTTWTAAHLVGIAEIDSQHAHLGRLVDGLLAMLKDDAGETAIRDALNALVDYARFHFATEERLMAEHEVVDIRHRNAHRQLLAQVNVLDLEEPSISIVLQQLREWLLRHIDTFDRQLGVDLRAKGCST